VQSYLQWVNRLSGIYQHWPPISGLSAILKLRSALTMASDEEGEKNPYFTHEKQGC